MKAKNFPFFGKMNEESEELFKIEMLKKQIIGLGRFATVVELRIPWIYLWECQMYYAVYIFMVGF